VKKNPSYGLGFWTKKYEKQNWIHIFGSEPHILFCQSICLTLDKILAQGILHTNIFNFLAFLIENLKVFSESNIFVLHTYFEFLLLKETGFGFDLNFDAYFISPKTGRTTPKEVGLAYRDKLFEVPKIWYTWDRVALYQDILNDTEIPCTELLESSKITWHFINMHILEIQNNFREAIMYNLNRQKESQRKQMVVT
jgi:recombinational DNA repair protein (RecF pathway)